MTESGRTFRYIEPLRKEIEQLQQTADKYQLELERCEDPKAQQSFKRLIENINSIQSKLIAKRKAIIQDLENIKEIDPEIYGYLYWHDVKGQSWNAAFNKTTPELMSVDPQEYARKRVYKFLAKQERIRASESGSESIQNRKKI